MKNKTYKGGDFKHLNIVISIIGLLIIFGVVWLLMGGGDDKKCSGNTEESDDYICSTGHILKPDAETITGDGDETCCDVIQVCTGVDCGDNARCDADLNNDGSYICNCNTGYTGSPASNGPAECVVDTPAPAPAPAPESCEWIDFASATPIPVGVTEDEWTVEGFTNYGLIEGYGNARGGADEVTIECDNEIDSLVYRRDPGTCGWAVTDSNAGCSNAPEHTAAPSLNDDQSWHLGDVNQDCNVVCAAVNRTCAGRDLWGVTDEESFNAALVNAGEDPSDLCSSYDDSNYIFNPRVKSDGTCYTKRTDGSVSDRETLCTKAHTSVSGRRLCLCDP